jgi:hypothetical protein
MKYSVMVAVIAAAAFFGAVTQSDAGTGFRGVVVLLEKDSVMVKSWNVEKTFVIGPDLAVAGKTPGAKAILELCQTVYIEYVSEGGVLKATRAKIEKESDCYQ